jgi:hypothetical protein
MVRHPDDPALSVAAMAVAFADTVAPLWEFTEP